MPFLTNDPLPQCLQTSSDIALSPPIGNRRGCGRYLLEVKCLEVRAAPGTNLLTSHLTVPAPYPLRQHVRDIHRRLVTPGMRGRPHSRRVTVRLVAGVTGCSRTPGLSSAAA